METNSTGGAVTKVIPSPNKSQYNTDLKKCVDFKVSLLFTLNLVRWLSRMGSLYRQLQQLPIASAGQLKPVTETDIITRSAIYCQLSNSDKTTVKVHFREQAHTQTSYSVQAISVKGFTSQSQDLRLGIVVTSQLVCWTDIFKRSMMLSPLKAYTTFRFRHATYNLTFKQISNINLSRNIGGLWEARR